MSNTMYHVPAVKEAPVVYPPETAAVAYGETVAYSVNNNNARSPTPEKKKWRNSMWLLGAIGLLAIIIILVVFFRIPEEKDAKIATEQPTSAPTMAGDEICQKKRVKITEICNIPDLDDGGSAEIKVLVNDKQYWPQQSINDCSEEYGTDGDSCVVPDSTLKGCFPLKNSIELPFGLDGAALGDQIKVTIVDLDFFWDDLLEIYAPTDQWYRPNVCERREFEFTGSDSTARIKMVVDFGDVENPCGVDEETLLTGLEDASVELDKMQAALKAYVSNDQANRRLIFGALAAGFRAVVSGARSFGRLFTRSGSASNVLSKIADLTQIGSLIFGQDNNDQANANQAKNEELFKQVFVRFDQIDQQLDNIQGQIKDGFENIKLVIQGEFAEQELDEWITVKLGILSSDYKGYMDRRHTNLSRPRYEEIFRNRCNGDDSPYNIFQVLYSHACLECQRFNGKSQQYILDTYVDLANANYPDDVTERVLWFRRSFGTVMIGALTEAIYLYSVCLYRTKDECKVVDPVWDARLEEMGDALEEVVNSLGEAENLLE